MLLGWQNLGIAASAQKTETSSIGKSLYFGASGGFSWGFAGMSLPKIKNNKKKKTQATSGVDKDFAVIFLFFIFRDVLQSCIVLACLDSNDILVKSKNIPCCLVWFSTEIRYSLF